MLCLDKRTKQPRHIRSLSVRPPSTTSIATYRPYLESKKLETASRKVHSMQENSFVDNKMVFKTACALIDPGGASMQG